MPAFTLLPNHHVETVRTGRDENLHTVQTHQPFQSKHFVEMEQVHAARVATFTEPSNSASTMTRLAEVDGVLTANQQVVLTVRTADCLPILLFHESGVVGALHAGRKGTQAGILRNALQILRTHFAVESDLHAWFGPRICAQCYQIDRETNLHFDLVAENTLQLYEHFSTDQVHLRISPHCTAHQNELFYSYRQEGPGMPLNYSAISLHQHG